MMSRLVAFLRDVKIELARVSWPTRKQTIQYTLAVIIMSIAVALFLGAWDTLFSWVLNHVLLKS
jgi:preprotein translocase subunit SecE